MVEVDLDEPMVVTGMTVQAERFFRVTSGTTCVETFDENEDPQGRGYRGC